MANVVTDPKAHPELVLGDFAAKDPAVTFTLAQVAFALSSTVGLFGFAERGWNPSPQAAVSVIAEVLTVVFGAASMLSSRTKTRLP